MPEQMVIFTRTYDLLSWLIPRSLSFPRSQRFVVTKRLQDAALSFQGRIIEANRQRGRMRPDRQRPADAEPDQAPLYPRLARRWQRLSEGQYRHVSEMVKEIGAMLGGWIEQTRGTKRQP